LLLRLRQACNHPYLLKDDNHANLTNPASIEMAKQLPREIVINLLEHLEVRHPTCCICVVRASWLLNNFLNRGNNFAFSLIKKRR
jgi:SNF2 family DNA or RNA helicase